MPKCDCGKYAKQLYCNHTSEWVFSRKFSAYFYDIFSQEHIWRAASAIYDQCSHFIPSESRNGLIKSKNGIKGKSNLTSINASDLTQIYNLVSRHCHLRTSHRKRSFKKAVLKNFATFTLKNLCPNLFLITSEV